MNGYAWAVFTCKLADKYQYAIEMAEKAVELEPEAAAIWDTLAWLYYAAGYHQKAVAAMEKAVAFNPGYDKRLTELKEEIKS